MCSVCNVLHVRPNNLFGRRLSFFLFSNANYIRCDHQPEVQMNTNKLLLFLSAFAFFLVCCHLLVCVFIFHYFPWTRSTHTRCVTAELSEDAHIFASIALTVWNIFKCFVPINSLMWVICVCVCYEQRCSCCSTRWIKNNVPFAHWNHLLFMEYLLLLFVASFDVLLKYKMLFRTVAHMVASMLNKL